jgi:hypothetical protein
LAVHVDWSIRAVDVITVVEAAMARYGVPTHLRSDNGPEFIAYAIQDWLKSKNVKTIYIAPGSPWENAYNAFNELNCSSKMVACLLAVSEILACAFFSISAKRASSVFSNIRLKTKRIPAVSVFVWLLSHAIIVAAMFFAFRGIVVVVLVHHHH